MTLRVVIADDEPIIIKGLRKLVDWGKLGMEIVAQAYDGQGLIEVIETFHPDIVISDISMPHLSGIDIIKEVNKRKLAVKIIFISAYQEFSYAKDAIAYGAVDYLVKPVGRQELENVLTKTISLIDMQGDEERRKDKLQQFERKSRNDEMQDWLILLTDGMLTPQSEAFQIMSNKLTGPLHSVGIIQVEQAGNESDRWPPQEKKLVDFALENVLSEIVSNYGKGHVFFKKNQYVFTIYHENLEDPVILANNIRDKIFSYLKLKVSIGLGDSVSELIKLADSYDQAEYALQLTYFKGLNNVIFYERVSQKPELGNELHILQSEVIQAMTSYDWLKANKDMEKLLKTIKAVTMGSKSLAVSTCFSTLLYIVQEVKKSGVDLSFDIHDLQSRLDQYETYSKMGQGIIAILEELYDRMDDKAGNKEHMLLARIKKHIEENYADEITLESVASMVFMNSYYLSSFFKKHTKQNFKQYVTDVRMDQAIRLLTQTNLMVYEIAEKVGYNNARHFSDMFKKKYGKLPQEYKQTIKEER